MAEQSGVVVLFGSGETSPSGQKVFDWLLRRLPEPVRVAILETPAGFELNSTQVAGRIGDFLCHHLQNYDPRVTIVPARKRGTRFSPDRPDIAALIHGSNVVFLGPGSPTYAIRQLQDSLVWHTVTASHRLGTAVVMASAAAIASGAFALPVYEIYKVGEDLHWRQGLDFFRPFGLSLVFVPHWNNQDGGGDLDTSRCYMGQARFGPLLAMLPADVTVVGIEEHTALAIDFEAESCQVLGKDGVVLLRNGQEQHMRSGQTFPIQELGPFAKPEPETGLPSEAWARVKAAHAMAKRDTPAEPPAEVLDLAQRREAVRAARDWDTADLLREEIAVLGWHVLDTRSGPKLEPMEGAQA